MIKNTILKITIFITIQLLLLLGVSWAKAASNPVCLSPSLSLGKLQRDTLFSARVFSAGEIRQENSYDNISKGSFLSEQDAEHMHWIEGGKKEDIVPVVVRYKNLQNQEVSEITGLKNNVEIFLPGKRRLFITDDEQNILTFWWKMLKQGVVQGKEAFLHIDAHLDTLIVQKTNQPIPEEASARDVYELAFTAQESGFLIPAFASGILDEGSAHLMDPRLDLLASRLEVAWEEPGKIRKVVVGKKRIKTDNAYFPMISVDLDALAGLTKEEACRYLEYIAGLCRKTKAITICTSPTYMQDQEAAVYYANYLTDLLTKQGTEELSIDSDEFLAIEEDFIKNQKAALTIQQAI